MGGRKRNTIGHVINGDFLSKVLAEMPACSSTVAVHPASLRQGNKRKGRYAVNAVTDYEDKEMRAKHNGHAFESVPFNFSFNDWKVFG